jgi:hypothetical protein
MTILVLSGQRILFPKVEERKAAVRINSNELAGKTIALFFF